MFNVCPISPGNHHWNNGEPIASISEPIKSFRTAKGAKNFAEKRAGQYNYGLAVWDDRKDRIDWGGSTKFEWSPIGRVAEDGE